MKVSLNKNKIPYELAFHCSQTFEMTNKELFSTRVGCVFLCCLPFEILRRRRNEFAFGETAKRVRVSGALNHPFVGLADRRHDNLVLECDAMYISTVESQRHFHAPSKSISKCPTSSSTQPSTDWHLSGVLRVCVRACLLFAFVLCAECTMTVVAETNSSELRRFAYYFSSYTRTAIFFFNLMQM